MASNPTVSEALDDMALALDLIHEVYLFGNSNAKNVLAMYDALITGLDGEYVVGAVGVAERIRNRTGQALQPAEIRAFLTPFLREICRAAGDRRVTSGYGELCKAVREIMIANSELMYSRNLTVGTPTFTSASTGTGAIKVLSTDKDGYQLQGVGAEAWSAVVRQDQTSGAQKHREVFEFYGVDRERTPLLWSGSGISTRITAVDCLSSGIVLNPSFDTNGASSDGDAPASTTAVTNWTLSGTAPFQLKSAATHQYRGYVGSDDVTQWALTFVDNGNAEQIVRTASRRAFRDDTPYYCQIAWKDFTSCDGTLTFEVGTRTASVDVTTGGGAWNVLALTLGQNSWFENFAEDALNIKITLASNTTGTLAVDDVVITPMVEVGGLWYVPVGGATAFLVNDTATWTISQGQFAKYSYWLWRSLEDQPGARIGMKGWFPTTTTGSSVTVGNTLEGL